MRTQGWAQPKQTKGAVLETATAREFNGGWNVVDNELNLSTRFGVIMDNVSRDEDGSVGVRWGTRFLSKPVNSTETGVGTHLINITYFQNSVICVLSDGKLRRVLGDGTYSTVWAGWGPTEFASFAVFNGDLIICNGTDKPLICNFDKAPNGVDFLVDLGTSLNTNTPICRYVTASARFLVMAGDPLEPNRVYISQEGTSGTWFGDPEPNNATNVDLGASGVPGDQIITGLNNYRENVVVGFPSALVLGKLGIFNEDTHVPTFNDVIENIGCHSHRSMVNLGKDLFMLDNNGVPSVARSLYSGSVEPKRVSELIDPAIGRNVAELIEADILLGTHAVYNLNDKQYMLFVPNHSEYQITLGVDPLQLNTDDDTWLRVWMPAHNMLTGEKVTLSGVTAFNNLNPVNINGVALTVTHVINEDYFVVKMTTPVNATTSLPLDGGGSAVKVVRMWTETYGYIYTFVDELKVRAWSRYRGWRWRASCTTELGNTVFADDMRLYTLGTANSPAYQDFLGVSDAFTKDIEWVYEQPWTDFGIRMREKHTRYIGFDTAGTGRFLCMMFVDRLYKINGVLQPNTLMEFAGGDTGGYGDSTQAYGGGRNTSDERLYAWTNRFKIGKLRFQGVAAEPLRIIAISLAYLQGKLQR